MKITNINTFRILLNENECCKNNVIVDCEYQTDNRCLRQGNYYVEYRLSFENSDLKSYLIGTWIPSSEHTIVDDAVEWFVRYLLPNIDEDIWSYEEALMVLDDYYDETSFCDDGCCGCDGCEECDFEEDFEDEAEIERYQTITTDICDGKCHVYVVNNFVERE